MATRPASRPESITIGPFQWSVHWDAKAVKEFGHASWLLEEVAGA